MKKKSTRLEIRLSYTEALLLFFLSGKPILLLYVKLKFAFGRLKPKSTIQAARMHLLESPLMIFLWIANWSVDFAKIDGKLFLFLCCSVLLSFLHLVHRYRFIFLLSVCVSLFIWLSVCGWKVGCPLLGLRLSYSYCLISTPVHVYRWFCLSISLFMSLSVFISSS